MLFISLMSILLMTDMTVNQFYCFCDETLGEVMKRTKEEGRSLERWPLLQITLLTFFIV